MTVIEKNIVETKYFDINKKVHLCSGKTLPKARIAYETYGKLNAKKDNAILLLHALTGDAHAMGYHKGDTKPGWWDDMVGKNKAFDTDKYFIICSNMLGGCSGTTGPNSINPETNREYGLDFPIVTIEDVVKVQKKLIDYFGIKKLCVAGGSMGGMQALEWALSYPELVTSVICIASTTKLSAQSIGFNAIGRNAILSDPDFNNGNYYHTNSKGPQKGLSIARMIGHITYLSERSMQNKFARRFQDKASPNFDFGIDFEVESYLAHQGKTFVDRFDANSYLYITKAVDYFDIAEKYGTLENAFKNTKARYLIISFSSDWLFPSSESKELVSALMKNKKDVSYCEIQSPYGHDAFLLEYETQTKIIKSFLKKGQ